MSINLPVTLERDLERYAQLEHISPAEAAAKFIQDGLLAKQHKAAKGELTDAELQNLEKADPAFAFFAKLPDSVLESISEASKHTRSERSTPRA